RHASEDEFAGLADASLMAREVPDLDLHHPWELSPDEAVELALGCEAAAFATDARIRNADGTTLSTHQGCRAYGNSHGFIGSYCSSRHSLSCVMIAEADGQMQRDYHYDVSRVAADLADAASIGRRAAERAVRRLGARPIPTCDVPVLFTADLATGLFGHFLAAISGANIYRKSSYLENALGQTLFPEWLSLDERPHLPRGLASAGYDGDGLATYAKPFVDSLFVTHGDEDQAALIRRMGRGLLVTELMGQGLSLVTGDYSRGAGGYWVENGEIQFPVQEVTIAGNLRDMFRQIVAVGCDVEKRSSIRTGSVLIERMEVAGR